MTINNFLRSLKPHRREHWMMLCLLAYAVNGVFKFYLPSAVCNVISFISGFSFLCIILGHLNRNNLKGFTGIVYGLFTLWTLLLTIRMFLIDDVRSTFQDYHGLTTWLLAFFVSPYLLPNLLPLFLLAFPKCYQFDYKYLWRIMWLLCVLYLCYYPFAFYNMMHFQWSFDRVAGTEWGDQGTYGDFIMNSTIGIASIAPVVIMVFFKKYLRKKHWQWYLVAYLGSILMTAYLARRGGLVMSVLYLALAWLMYALYDKKTSNIGLIFISAIVIFLGYSFFSGFADSFFSTLSERGTEDSRSGVELAFFIDMKDVNDWIFGRGWFGQYYDFNFRANRLGVETGYLTLILRGGLVYLIPYVLIMAMSFYNGFFRSKNLFCKSFAILCLMKILSLYPFGWPDFDFLHFIIWLGVWVCNTKSILCMNDGQIKEFFFEETKKRIFFQGIK